MSAIRATFNPASGQTDVGDAFSGSAAPSNLATEESLANRHVNVPGAVRHTGGVSQVEDLGARAYNAGREAGPVSETGSPIGNRELRDTDVLTIDGMTIRVKEARRMGLIGGQGDGPFGGSRETPGAPQEAPEEAPEEAPQASPLQLSEEGLAAFDSLADNVSGSSISSIVADFLDNGGISEESLSRAASDAGVEPDEIAARVTAVHAAYAGATVERLGLHDPEGFSAWAAEDGPARPPSARQRSSFPHGGHRRPR